MSKYKKVKCMNCNKLQEITRKKEKSDELGKHMICSSCKSSFDI